MCRSAASAESTGWSHVHSPSRVKVNTGVPVPSSTRGWVRPRLNSIRADSVMSDVDDEPSSSSTVIESDGVVSMCPIVPGGLRMAFRNRSSLSDDRYQRQRQVGSFLCETDLAQGPCPGVGDLGATYRVGDVARMHHQEIAIDFGGDDPDMP
jgi:hypothetical protein